MRLVRGWDWWGVRGETGEGVGLVGSEVGEGVGLVGSEG